jgi:hypothetical protein
MAKDIFAGALIGVWFLFALFVLVANRRDRRRMDELWAAAHKADQKFYDAMYQYMAEPHRKEEE